jgi:hypothetical protein
MEHMKQDDLIKRLENLETPDIELSGHRQQLRAALLRSERFNSRTAVGWARVLAPIAAAVALVAAIGFFNLVQPRIQIAQARGIASSDPRVQALVEEHGLGIAEVELRDGAAFILLVPASIATARLSESAAYTGDTGCWLERILGVAWPAKTFEEEAGDIVLAPPESESPGTFVLKVDLKTREVSGMREFEETATLRGISLDEIEFSEFGSSDASETDELDPRQEE